MEAKLGSLLDVKEGIIVHGCNAQGVMGSGVAKEVREKYPQAYQKYREAYEKAIKLGMPHLPVGKIIWCPISSESPKLTIANAITQKNYGRDPNVQYVSYEAIDMVFEKIAKVAKEHQVPVHFPLIGAALGGGKWEEIQPIIEKRLKGVEHHLWVISPIISQKLNKVKP